MMMDGQELNRKKQEKGRSRARTGNSNGRNRRSSRNLNSQVLENNSDIKEVRKQEGLRFIQNPWPNWSIRSKLLF